MVRVYRHDMTVPAEAVVTRGQVTSVFVVDQGTARLRLVRLRGLAVEAGLSNGDVVILSPPAALSDGRRIVEGGQR